MYRLRAKTPEEIAKERIVDHAIAVIARRIGRLRFAVLAGVLCPALLLSGCTLVYGGLLSSRTVGGFAAVYSAAPLPLCFPRVEGGGGVRQLVLTVAPRR